MSEKIKRIVSSILMETKVSTLPIPLKKILSIYNLTLKEVALERNISGFLYKKGDYQLITINKTDPHVRKRFTIAHELGHYFLNHQGDLFIDKGHLFRQSSPNVGNVKWEREANKFAAELLMPEQLITEYLKNRDIDNLDDITVIAKKISVSTQALTYRLINLGLITFY